MLPEEWAAVEALVAELEGRFDLPDDDVLYPLVQAVRAALGVVEPA